MRTFNYTIILILLIAAAGFAQVKYTWTGGSGSWQTASNWNPSGVPGIADTAVINSGTVTNDQWQLQLQGYYQNAGTINGTGNISITAKFIWVSGTHGGTGTTTITSTGTGSIGGIYTKTLSRMIVNEGSFVWSATTVSFNPGAGITNNGTFDAQAESFVLGSGGNGSIINNGTFNRTTGTGNATIATTFINNGTTNVQSGTLLSTLSTTGSGAFVINPGNKFIISNGNHTLGGNTISGGGTLELPSGTLNLTGSPVNISSGTTFLQDGGTIAGDGALLINGTYNWLSGTHGGTGTTTITSTATGSIGGIYTKTLSRMIVNEGSFVWSATTVSFNPGAGITNNGTFDAQAGSFVLGSGGNGSIINNGTFNRTTGTGNAQ
jgi:fibronectin-binding autotransporter adhesin